MKKINFIFLLFLAIPVQLDAQGIRAKYESRVVYLPDLKPNYNETSKSLLYEDVISSELNQDQLYKKFNRWVALNFKSANNVIQLNDKINHNIIVKGQLQASWKKRNNRIFTLPFTLDLKMKDGRYKYKLEVSSYIRSVPDLDIYDPEKLIDNRLFNEYQQTHRYGSGDVYLYFDNEIKLFLEGMKSFVDSKEENDDW